MWLMVLFDDLLMRFGGIFGLLGIILGVYLTFMLCIVQIKGDRSIANVAWVGGCMIVALCSFVYSLVVYPFIFEQFTYFWKPLLVTILTMIWGGRLILYVYLRYKGDDPRYQSWKQHGLKAFFLNAGYIYILNGIMIVIMSQVLLSLILGFGAGFSYLDMLGIAVWIIGFYFEAVSDYQLYNFTRNPANKGKVMCYGLWRYSRHPNYFGESLMWWGLYILALRVPFGIFAIITPLTITFLLRFVTGVPWVEKAMEKNPEYQDYKKHTNTFVPWLPH